MEWMVFLTGLRKIRAGFRRSFHRLRVIVLIVALVATGWLVFVHFDAFNVGGRIHSTWASLTAQSSPVDPSSMTGTVSRIVDGDTVDVLSAAETVRVRILGIDTPEVAHPGNAAECGGDTATASLTTLLPVGATVTITSDPVSDETDRYGRRLAYVSTDTVPDVGLRQIQNGLAEAWYPSGEPAPSRYAAYSEAEKIAHGNQTGSWGVCSTLGR